MKRFLLVFTLIAAVLLVSACGGSGSSAEPQKVTVTTTEFTFSPAAIDVKVGQPVTIEITNNGTLDHEFMVGKDVIMDNSLPTGYKTDMFTTAGVTPDVSGKTTDDPSAVAIGWHVIVPPGGTATVTFTPNDKMVGQWEMGCFVQGGSHYQAGMKGTFTVSK